MRTDEPPPRLIAVDWKTVSLATESDALALWRDVIKPTGDDWQEKLDEIPAEAARPLALALLTGGNFQCMPTVTPGDCVSVQYDVNTPKQAAGFDDPCLRRVLALWAFSQLEPTDGAALMPALRIIAAIPPPESELIAAALSAAASADRALLLELIGIAIAAGSSDAVDGVLTLLDVPSLVTAATIHHSPGALAVLSAEGQRAVYIHAVTDTKLPTGARIGAIADLLQSDMLKDPPTLEMDLRTGLTTAAQDPDCTVAAVAVRALHVAGVKGVLPRPGKTPAATMRALCVLASYERLQGSDEISLLPNFVPAKGLELISIAYDPLSETDEDGDGNLHTIRRADLIPRDLLVLPELDGVIKAMKACTGTTCKSKEMEVRFTIKGGKLARMELAERAPCPPNFMSP